MSSINNVGVFGDNVLCGNCLRVMPFTLARHHGDELCQCGGEFCGCAECNETITQLSSGVRNASDLGTYTDIGSWSPEFGISSVYAAKDACEPQLPEKY
ncbi:MAG: hypothetical protein D3906_01480 [Candidatus Electrothrix sp. AUS1_2]|nr:hypothetical protein [Candidatus Electrothrix sp. AUS1_2]